MPGYAAYLRSQAWAHRKAEALERAGRRCQVCGHDRRLDVHHNTYERIGAELPGDLVVLCRLCHNRFHGRLPKPPAREGHRARPAELNLLRVLVQHPEKRALSIERMIGDVVGVGPDDFLDPVAREVVTALIDEADLTRMSTEAMALYRRLETMPPPLGVFSDALRAIARARQARP
jgi:hypothetical protein